MSAFPSKPVRRSQRIAAQKPNYASNINDDSRRSNRAGADDNTYDDLIQYGYDPDNYNYDQKKLNEALARYNGDINNNGNIMDLFSVDGIKRRRNNILFFGPVGTRLPDLRDRLQKLIEEEIPILEKQSKKKKPNYNTIRDHVFITRGEQRTLSTKLNKIMLIGKELIRAVLQARREEKEFIEASIESKEEKIKDHNDWLTIIGERIKDILDSGKQKKTIIL